ncbi:hypothetical protein, partial [Shewanella seohaensis]|uniref:hypothetical protein n=1 Tax=Shewanella seohaensis TaxID=755175 RepID=UPI0020102006
IVKEHLTSAFALPLSGSGLRILRISLVASRRFCKLLGAFESTAHFAFDSHCNRVSFRCLPCQWMRIIGSRTFYARAFFRFFALFFKSLFTPKLGTSYPLLIPKVIHIPKFLTIVVGRY